MVLLSDVSMSGVLIYTRIIVIYKILGSFLPFSFQTSESLSTFTIS